jgi:hypothetical protein
MDEENSEGFAVKFIRLTTGEDLVAEVTSYEDKNGNIEYKVTSPLKVLYTQGRVEGTISVVFIQWIFSNLCSNQDFVLKDKDVLTMIEPNLSMIDYYYESVAKQYRHNAELYNKLYGSEEDIPAPSEHSAYAEEDDIDDHDLDSDHRKMLEEMMDKLKKGKGTLH